MVSAAKALLPSDRGERLIRAQGSPWGVRRLLFFLCASATGSLVSSLIGAGSAAILRTPGWTPASAVYVIAGFSFFLSGCLSNIFFRLFARRLVSRVQSACRQRDLTGPQPH